VGISGESGQWYQSDEGYSLIRDIAVVPELTLAYQANTNNNSSWDEPIEIGLRVSYWNINFEQGHHRFNQYQYLRSIVGSGIGYSFFGGIPINGNKLSFELGPIGAMDFRGYGNGRFGCISVFYSHSF